MKKLLFLILMLILNIFVLNAKESKYVDKIIKLYELKTGKTLEFNATKKGDGYDIYITTTNKLYKEIFNKKPIHIFVDEGPFVFKPKFTLASAGLSAKGFLFDLFNPELKKDLNKTVKKEPKYSYEAIISFGGELKEKIIIDPFEIQNSDVTAKLSKTVIDNKFDLNTFTGKSELKIDNVILKPKKEDGLLELKNVEFDTKVTQEPIDDIMLFANSSLSAKNVIFKAKDKKGNNIHTNFAFKILGETKRVDREFLDFILEYNFKALDEKTIAFAKGIKQSDLRFSLQKLGIEGVIEFLKLSKELEKVNNELYEATKKDDSLSMQKAILKQQELLNKSISIFNKTFIGNKSRVKVDLNLISDKKSFVKLDLLYKGKPISGNIQSALITLAAQQLKLFDGDFEIQVDSSLVTSINPLAILGLDLLKAKGFATVKDGVYHLKGQIKDGKIVINGKAYTIPELTKALF